jgi:hypothetical protein
MRGGKIKMTYQTGNRQKYNTSDSAAQGYYQGNYGYGYRCYSKPLDIHSALMPLISQIRKYDALRLKLEREGGNVAHLNEITFILSEVFSIKGRFGEKKARLKNQDSVLTAIRDMDWDLHLDIRQLHTYMPVYYLFRVRRDYWGEYSLIAEDFYMSPGYPVTDKRFIRAMSMGHEVFFLRLSQFRKGLAGIESVVDDALDERIDSILYALGRNVFSAAWHEDQMLGILTAKHLGLPNFHEAIELLYLCLSGELCELRGAVTTDKKMIQFFKEVYKQQAICSLLELLNNMDGRMLNDLPRRAGGLYKRLLQAFSDFLGVEVKWGSRNLQMPVWKLLYGNFSRLDLVGKVLRREKELLDAAKRLNAESLAVTNELLTC